MTQCSRKQGASHFFFFFYASVVSTVVFGLVVKDFLLFEYWTPTTLHVVQATAVSRRNANLHFSFFSLHYFSSGSSLQLFPPTGTHLPKSVQMSGHVHYIFVCVCGCLSPLLCVAILAWLSQCNKPPGLIMSFLNVRTLPVSLRFM